MYLLHKLEFFVGISIIEKYGLLYKHQWNTKWAFPRKLHIFTREDNMLSSHVKRSLSLWLHNNPAFHDLVFHCCLYNKYTRLWIWILSSRVQRDISCSTRYLTCSLRSLMRYRVDHSKIKFISMRGHATSSMSPHVTNYNNFTCVFR